jgi:cytochrome c553
MRVADRWSRWTGRAVVMVAVTLIIASDTAAQTRPFVVHDLDFEIYRTRVEPIFLRDRGGFGPGQSACVTCHSHSNTPLELQPLQTDANGQPYWTEEQSLLNFVVVSGLVSPGRPQQSLLLRTPLAEAAGGIPFHVGGKFWDSQDDPDFQVLAEWVETADSTAPSAAVDARFVPSFEFFRDCVQRIFLDREEESDRTECAACHGGGVRGFAQALPEGRDYWNEEESRENFVVLMRYIEPVDAGGDGGHSGGRRWLSQDDPEWLMLADWIRGRTPACIVQDR